MKLQTKVLLLLIPLALIAGILILLFARASVNTILVEGIAQRGILELGEVSSKVNSGMRTREENALLPLLHASLERMKASYAVALDPAGVVLAHTNVVEKGKTYSDPITRQVLDHDRPEFHLMNVQGGKILDVSMPVWSGGDDFLLSNEKGGKTRLGTLRLGLPIDQALETQARILGRITLILLGTGSVVLIVILLYLRNMLFPMRILAEAAGKIGKGQYGVTVPVQTEDELGALTLSFNKMSEDLAVTTVSKDSLQHVVSLLNATLESTTDGILVVDQNGKITKFNQKFVQMWNIPQSIIATQDDSKALEYVLGQLKEPEQFLSKVRELYTRPSDESFDLLEFKNGSVFERYSQPQRLENKVIGRVWSFRDVSERKRLESMLVQSEKLSAVGQLAAGVAHEINNPLGIILGFAQSAVKRIKDGDPLILPIKSIEREALRCKNLVQNLLTFSRQNKPKMEEFNLNETAQATLSIIEAQARVKSVEIVRELGVLDPLLGDKSQIQQVIVNLCSNAIDAMPNGGKIAIRTRKNLAEGKRGVILEVEDNGSGIPKEIQDKIFNPFFTTKEVGKGTGLGLSLVYEIIQRHNGNIGLKSKVGYGTTFTVFLPAKDSPDPVKNGA